MRLKHLLSVFFTLLTLGVGQMWGATYTFTSTSWGYSEGSGVWTSDKAGSQTGDSRGIAVQKGASGAGAHTASISNITKVAINCSKSGNGVGSISVKVGNTEVISRSSFNTTATAYESATLSNLTGSVSFTVTCTTSTIYVKSITITTASGGYTITYNCDGADSGCPANETKKTSLPNPLPEAPIKAGFDFDGWYTNSTKTVAAVAGASIDANTTLYAKWITCHETTTIFYPKQGSKPSAGSFNYTGVNNPGNNTNVNTASTNSLTGQTFTSCNGTQISFSHSSGSNYNTIWYASSAYDIRLYNNNPVTFTAPSGYIIKSVSKTVGSTTTDLTTNNATSTYSYTKSGTGGEAVKYFKVVIEESCQSLGQINGSFSFTNVSPTSVTVGVPSDYTDKSNENLTGYIFKRYAASTGGSAVETIETNAADKTTATFSTGLVANTTYYYTIIAKHSSSSCNSVETSPRKEHTISSYTVSYANGGGSGTNPGAHDPVLANGKVTLKYNTFDAPTGKEFRVWNDGTSDLDEGEEYTVTANTVMTAQWQCMEPGFTKNLSTTQVNYLQGETAAKLSVTAAANGAELSYAWEMSANGTTGWSSVGTNSNEYTPSTATAGDQYYHCIVTNLADGCTESKATSAVAHIHVDVPAACLEPVISVASDTYYEDKSVTITCGTVGAAIYYTTDGSTTPTSGSTLYEGAITVDHSMTIKAIAIKAGMDNSTVAEATYTIKCETPTIVLAAGNYTGVQTTTITKGYGTKIYYTTDGSTPSNTNGTEYTGAVSIDQPMTLKAIVWKDGCTNSEVASAAYTLKCTTPTFNKETGTYTGAQSITLSGTAGADIYYTLDGTAPSKTNGTKYTAAIEVSANQTVKAIAVKEGWGDSEIASATYTIQYNVYWWVNGVAWTEKGGSTLVTYGQTATAPTTAPTKADGCGDKFMGWTETQNYEDDDAAPTGMFTETSAAITGETNFYAVFADYGEEE